MKDAVIFIVGATASGKTAGALDLASGMPVEIVNADSRQVYRGMTIGTAKPTPAQQAVARHHLLDVVAPREGFSLAEFLAIARPAIADIQERGAFPVVVGGTGQYVWGLVEGWRVPQVPPQAELRARLEREATEDGPGALHARLARVDAEAAAAIDPQNVRRVVRALEVWEVTGERFSEQRRKETPGFRPLLFGMDVPRTDLHRRIEMRLEQMLAAGWLDEVRALLNEGCSPDLPSFSSTGYREMAAYLTGQLTLEEAKARAQAATNRLARMQATWFRRDDPRITWVPGAESLREAVRQALGCL
ncbi:MAG: tRNA (adenosine(37)-N6)-dimethylallyltransferase MiaA [Dehalococcoidia bacterium]